MSEKFNIILASASPRREELLQRYIRKFEIIPTDIDESIDINNIKTIENCRSEIEKISYKKALAVGKRKNNSLIIGADTTVYLNGKIYGKPTDIIEAKSFLKALSSHSHQVITGVTVVDNEDKIVVQLSEVTNVKFIDYNDNLIRWYLSHDEYKDKAGGYAIQGLGAIFVDSIEGDYDNVVGLPISKVIRALLSKSVDILGVI